MDDRLRTVEWAREQLGHRRINTTRDWLRRHGVRVVAGRFLEESFWRVWHQPGRIDLSGVRKAVSR